MMRNVLLVSTLILLSGCADEERTSEPVEDEPVVQEQVVPEEPVPIQDSTELTIEETEGPSLLESATLAHADRKESEPKGPERDEAEKFRPGEQLELTVTVIEVPEKLAAWVHWFGPDDQKRESEQKSVPENRRVVFRADTSDWTPGTYEAEIYIGGDLVDTKRFRLTEGDTAEAE